MLSLVGAVWTNPPPSPISAWRSVVSPSTPCGPAPRRPPPGGCAPRCAAGPRRGAASGVGRPGGPARTCRPRGVFGSFRPVRGCARGDARVSRCAAGRPAWNSLTPRHVYVRTLPGPNLWTIYYLVTNPLSPPPRSTGQLAHAIVSVARIHVAVHVFRRPSGSESRYRARRRGYGGGPDIASRNAATRSPTSASRSPATMR